MCLLLVDCRKDAVLPQIIVGNLRREGLLRI